MKSSSVIIEVDILQRLINICFYRSNENVWSIIIQQAILGKPPHHLWRKNAIMCIQKMQCSFAFSGNFSKVEDIMKNIKLSLLDAGNSL